MYQGNILFLCLLAYFEPKEREETKNWLKFGVDGYT